MVAKKKTEEPEELKLKASGDAVHGRLYANFINVSFSPWDCTLRFCDAPPFAEVEKFKKDGFLVLKPMVDIVIPTDVVPELINALQQAFDGHMKALEESKNETKNRTKKN
jgi:hypothetical protein